MSTPLIAPSDDRALDTKIGILLRSGVLLSASVIALGGLIYFIQSGNTVVSYHHFTGTPASLRLIPEILQGAAHGNGLAVIQFGILLLMATPVARVAFSVIAFAYEHDWQYVVISGIVLAVLMYSLIGHGGF